jgi:exodeoxyribonuclease VII small subunit
MTEPTSLTFEAAYDRLHQIQTRVTSEEVPVAEMCDLFAEGKGLQQACMTYLDEQKSRVEDIERGEGIQAFRIVAPSDGDSRATSNDDASRGEIEFADDDFELEPASPPAPPASAPASSAEDDIPF